MTPLAKIDGGAHRILARRYGLPEDALIPPLVSGTSREGDALLKLARELRRRGISEGLVHLRRAWIAHSCSALALFELEFERAHAVGRRHNEAIKVAGQKWLADQRRSLAIKAKNRERNRKIRGLAISLPAADIEQRFGVKPRQQRNIKRPKR